MVGDGGRADGIASVLIGGSVTMGQMRLTDGVVSITTVDKESGEDDEAILSEHGAMGETGEGISGKTDTEDQR